MPRISVIYNEKWDITECEAGLVSCDATLCLWVSGSDVWKDRSAFVFRGFSSQKNI